MAIYITQIDKHKFVCGLFWQSLSRPRELWREAADLGKKIDSDLMVVRRDQSTAQAGFAQTTDGARRMLYSLGAAVSKTLALEGAYYDGLQQPVHNWLGAFKLPEGMWAYFAVRDANFLPNGDFVGSKEEVLERLYGDYALGGWNVVIGEPELADQQFHNFNARGIASMLPHRKNGSIRVHRWWRLRQIRSQQIPWNRLALGGVLLLLAVALLWFQQRQARLERLRQEQEIEARYQQQRALMVSAQPWASMPLPRQMLRSCTEQLVQMTPGGWHLENYVCTGEQISYAWSRQESTIAMLHAEVPDAQIASNGDLASLVLPRVAAAGRPAQPGAAAAGANGEALLPARDVLDPMMSQLQALGVPFKLSAQAAATVTPGARPINSWQSYRFTVAAHGVEPQQIGALLERPGVRVDKVAFSGMAWLIEGVIYAK